MCGAAGHCRHTEAADHPRYRARRRRRRGRSGVGRRQETRRQGDTGGEAALVKFAHDTFSEAARGEIGLAKAACPSVRSSSATTGSSPRHNRGCSAAHVAPAEIAADQRRRQRTYRDAPYSTLLPCFLCSGAPVQFGVPKSCRRESVNFPAAKARRHSPDLYAPRARLSTCATRRASKLMARFVRAPDCGTRHRR